MPIGAQGSVLLFKYTKVSIVIKKPVIGSARICHRADHHPEKEELRVFMTVPEAGAGPPSSTHMNIIRMVFIFLQLRTYLFSILISTPFPLSKLH